jgi:superoxide dismutase, Fe-Mn family
MNIFHLPPYYLLAIVAVATVAVIATYKYACKSNSNCSSKACNKSIAPTKLTFFGFKHPFSLDPLPYDYNALEPHIDEETMRLHHTKHHQAYIDNVNKALDEAPEFKKHTIEEILTNLDALPDAVKERVRNNAGGHFNHTLFWQMMSPQGGGKPSEIIAAQLNKWFGSFEEFKTLFDKAAISRFGSGWAWLCLTPEKKLVIVSTPNQDTPLAQGLFPILALDVWEHAYYIKYRNRRAEYITAWWDVINWKHVEQLYHDGLKIFNK